MAHAVSVASSGVPASILAVEGRRPGTGPSRRASGSSGVDSIGGGWAVARGERGCGSGSSHGEDRRGEIVQRARRQNVEV